MRHRSILVSRIAVVVLVAVAVAFLVVPGVAADRRTQHASHMHKALHELKEAKHELKEAKHDFGGNREKALKAVDHAIHELEVALHHHHHSQSNNK